MTSYASVVNKVLMLLNFIHEICNRFLAVDNLPKSRKPSVGGFKTRAVAHD